MTNKHLQEVEKQLEDIDQLKEGLLPRIGQLREQLAELESDMSEAVLDDALGLAKSNGKIETLRERINEVNKKLGDAERLRDATESKQGVLRTREQELKLKVSEAEFRDLAPQVSRLADDYLKQREDLRKTVEEYNEKHTRAEWLRIGVQTLRNDLAVGRQDVSDLPQLRHLNWTDTQIHISPEQLQGQKRW